MAKNFRPRPTSINVASLITWAFVLGIAALLVVILLKLLM